MGKFARLLRTPPADLLLIARAWCLFYRVDWVIRHRDYARWPQWMKIEPGDAGDQGEVDKREREAIARIIRLSEVAGRHHVRPMNCLRRCLVQRSLLRERLGVRADLILGVKNQGGFAAHSWLRADGVVVNDTPQNLAQYDVLSSAGALAPSLHSLFRRD